MPQGKVLTEKLAVAQLLFQFLVFYKTCGVINVFTTA